MLGFDNPIHIVFLLVVALLVFGAKRLPEMGRSLGSGMRGFRDALSGEVDWGGQGAELPSPPQAAPSASYETAGMHEPALPGVHEPALPGAREPALPGAREPALPGVYEPALPGAREQQGS